MMAAGGQGPIEETSGAEFNATRALTLAQSVVSAEGHVSLPVYIAGIEELYKLFSQFEGQNVEFLLSGMDVKLSILNEECSSSSSNSSGRESGTKEQQQQEQQQQHHYSTVQSMVAYEKQHGIIEREDRPSGTVTLLRIHRMIEFVCAGLEKINDPAISDEALPQELVAAYTSTMGRYHPQLMSSSIQWALPHVVPSRAQLMAQIGLDPDPDLDPDRRAAESAACWLVQITTCLRKCYDAIQKVYADHGLLNLSQGSL